MFSFSLQGSAVMKDYSGKRVPQTGRLAFRSSLAVITCYVSFLFLHSYVTLAQFGRVMQMQNCGKILKIA